MKHCMYNKYTHNPEHITKIGALYTIKYGADIGSIFLKAVLADTIPVPLLPQVITSVIDLGIKKSKFLASKQLDKVFHPHYEQAVNNKTETLDDDKAELDDINSQWYSSFQEELNEELVCLGD